MLSTLHNLVHRIAEWWRDWRSKADGTEATDVYDVPAADSPTVTGGEVHAAFHTEQGFL